MEPHYLQLESNDANTDGCAVTAYFPEGTTVEQATEWAKREDRPWTKCPGSLGLDVEDEWFEVIQTEKQPFEGFVRFQFHPTC